jgi:hypothetical protein
MQSFELKPLRSVGLVASAAPPPGVAPSGDEAKDSYAFDPIIGEELRYHSWTERVFRLPAP